MKFYAPLIPAILFSIAAPAVVNAAELKPFDRASFNAAQSANKPILVHVKAWWCPVCASQANTIRSNKSNPAYKDLIIFQINYDSQKADWKSFGVQKQGTILGYRGKSQVGRLDFVTDKGEINSLVALTVR